MRSVRRLSTGSRGRRGKESGEGAEEGARERARNTEAVPDTKEVEDHDLDYAVYSDR